MVCPIKDSMDINEFTGESFAGRAIARGLLRESSRRRRVIQSELPKTSYYRECGTNQVSSPFHGGIVLPGHFRLRFKCLDAVEVFANSASMSFLCVICAGMGAALVTKKRSRW